MAKININEVKKAISESGAQWTAEENRFTNLSTEELKLFLGYVPGPNDLSFQEMEKVSKENHMKFLSKGGNRARTESNAAATVGAIYPVTYDLRNANGQNFITEVKDQGSCGSCVAFGVLANAEGSLRKHNNDPILSVDFSEAHLFYCYARSEGRTCANGWWSEFALNHLRDGGIVDESCFHYTSVDQTCNLCSDEQRRLTKIIGWHRIISTDEMKTWISTRGPLTTSFIIYEDFYSYSSGIYRHVWGINVAGHCVCVVGYNDAEQYWICKNSWGSGWGEKGYFRIAYGEAGIDAQMDAIDGFVSPLSPISITAISASGSEAGNPAANAIDNNLGTRWSNLGVGSWIRADLGSQKAVSRVDIAWYKGNERQSSFEVSVSNDGSSFTTVFTGRSSGTTTSQEKYSLPPGTQARYIRVKVNGNNQNNWASLTEIDVYGSSISPAANLPITAISASGSEAGNPAANAIDNNLGTRWSNLGVGSWIRADLGSQKAVSRVDIAWYKGNERQSSFEVSVSNDGSSFTTVFTGRGSGTTTSQEKYSLPPGTQARYIRVKVNGNNQNNWASITEIDVYGS